MSAFVLVLVALAAGVDGRRTAALAAGVAILWVVGTVDDRRTVPPGCRVAVEAALAAGSWALGLGWDTGLGAAVDLVLTVAWVVLVVNALNLFDNMDGAASTMALVVGLAIAALGALADDPWAAAAGAALAGACLGFLRHNLATPARIFLGDGGSMPAGFVVATLTMTAASAAAPGAQALPAGLLLVGLLLVDTTLVVLSRRRRGISILTGGRDHLTHRARRHLGTPRRVAVALGTTQVLVCAAGVTVARGPVALAVVGAVAYLALAAVGVGLLLAEEQRLAAPAPGAQSE
nr:MraY family glycosyltransferase [Patulibacter sp. SYSU D01012]